MWLLRNGTVLHTQVSKKKCKCDDELQLVIQQRLCQDHLRMGRSKKKMWGTQGDDKYTVCPIYCNDVYIVKEAQ